MKLPESLQRMLDCEDVHEHRTRLAVLEAAGDTDLRDTSCIRVWHRGRAYGFPVRRALLICIDVYSNRRGACKK